MFRSLLLSLVWATLLLLAPRAQAYPVRVTSVPQVDLSRYLGKWYEIAALPMFFQRNCVGDTTVTPRCRVPWMCGFCSTNTRTRSGRASDAWTYEP